jgi:hypothetical protein
LSNINLTGALPISNSGTKNVRNLLGHSDPTYVQGRDVVLQACLTGSLSDGFAKQLSSALGANVTAPNGDLWVTPDGGTYIDGGGKWVNFTPSSVLLK